MKSVGGSNVWKFFYFGLYLSIVWVLGFTRVEARLRCYSCDIKVKDPANSKDPCFDPKASGAKPVDCPTGGDPNDVLACYKKYDKSKESSSSSPFLERGCTYRKKGKEPCPMFAEGPVCYCNDRDLCNDEVGYKVSKYNIEGSSNVKNSTTTATDNASFILLQALLVLTNTLVSI